MVSGIVRAANPGNQPSDALCVGALGLSLAMATKGTTYPETCCFLCKVLYLGLRESTKLLPFW